jgi:hypothetical protein
MPSTYLRRTLGARPHERSGPRPHEGLRPRPHGHLAPRSARSGRARNLVLGSLVALSTSTSPLAAQDPPRTGGEIGGSVVEATTGRVLAGAMVRVAGTQTTTTTDDSGGFRLVGVPPGVVALEVSALGFLTALHTDVVVGPSRPVHVTVRLTAAPIALEGVRVGPSAFPPAREAPTSTHRLRTEEIRRAPGAWEDVVRAVSILPGVAPTAVHDNMLVVRGGAPFENLFVVDGLAVPNINHFAAQGSSGGYTGLLHLDLIDRVEFAAGGFGASRGDRVGSVTTIDLRNGLEEWHAATANLSLTGFGGTVEGPVGSGSYLAAVRRSYADLVLEWAGEPFFMRYWDVNARVTQRLGGRDQLSWTFVGALDEFGFNIETPDDLYETAFLAANDDQYFSSLNWTRTGERSRLVVTGGRISHAFHSFENDTLGTPAFSNRSREAETSLRIGYTRNLHGGATVDLGGTVRRHGPLRYDISLIGEQRPDPEGVPRPLDVDTSFVAVRLGGFAEATVPWGRRLTTRVGGRVDRYGELGAVRFAPRGSATLDLDRGTSLNLAAGRYWQAPAFIWLLGDPANAERLTPFRVDQAVVGVQRPIGAETKLQLETYYKRYADYPARIWHPQAVVAPGNFESVSADVPFGLEPLASQGTGRAYGVEILLHKRLGEVPVYGIASLTLGRSEFAGMDGVRRRGRYDVPGIGNLALGWRPGPEWDLGLRFRVASGHPRPPFVTQGPLTGRHDLERYGEGGRMPTFHALDIRVDRRWTIRGAQASTYLDIQDVYNRDNPIGYYWDWREEGPRYESAIGLFPSLGVSVQF